MNSIKDEFFKRNLNFIKQVRIKSRKYYIYNCIIHPELGNLKMRKCSFENNSTCKKCANEKKVKDFKKIYIEKFLNFVESLKDYECLTEYKNANAKILLKHKICNKKFEVTPGHFKNGTRCPHCVGRYRTKEEFEKLVLELEGNSYSVIGNYTLSGNKIEIKHEECDSTYSVTPSKFLNGRRCPNCSNNRNSRLSRKVNKFLIKNNINFEREYSFYNCRGKKRPLLFDFMIYDNYNNVKFLIEVDGIQHFKPVDFFGGEKALKEQKKRDLIKNKYCKESNIPLLRIAYFEEPISEKLINGFLNKFLQKKS